VAGLTETMTSYIYGVRFFIAPPRPVIAIARTSNQYYLEIVKSYSCRRTIMLLEIYVWSWLHLHPVHALRRTVKLLGISLLVLGPLIYANIALAQNGSKLSLPTFVIEAGQPTPR
jgi:hypothetical protein